MALTREVQKAVVRVWSTREVDLAAGIIELASAILDLDAALRQLEQKVERAEHLGSGLRDGGT